MTNFFTKLTSAFTLLALVASFVPAAVFAQEAPAEVVEATPEIISDVVIETPSVEETPAEEQEGGIISDIVDTVVDIFSVNEESSEILAVGEKYVNDNAAPGGNGSLGAPFRTIQEAIDAAVDGDTIYVFPGTYSETASGRTVSTMGGTTYQFGLFFEEGKDGISIVGVDEDGEVITDANDVNTPDIITNSTSNFGPSGVFVDADNITIQGVDIKSNTSGDNKSIEVVGNGFTLRDSNIDVVGGSVYINDFTGAGTRVNSYTIEENNFNTGSTLDIASGAGASTASPVTDRTITGNTFNGANATTRALISFSGGGQPWYVYPVGGAIITGNTFKDADQYIRARGAYAEDQFDWSAYFADNTFTAGAAVVTAPTGDTRSYGYATYTNVRRIGRTIGGELANAVAGDTVHVAAGLYSEEIVLDKAVAVIGSGSDASGTVIKNPAGGDSAVGAVQISASGTAAFPILLQDLRILPNGKSGISVGKFTQSTGTNVEYVSLDNVQVIGTNLNACTEQERGLYVDNTSSLKHLTVAGSAFNNLAYGWYFQKSVSADTSSVQFVAVDDTTFNHNGLKGIYAEKLSDAAFTNVTVDENGFSSVADLAACSYFQPNMAGVDINLKAGTYASISFVNPTITDNAVGATNGAGLAIKARTDGATYGAFPATLAGVSVTGGTVTGNKTGLRFGEPNKAGAGPTNVVVSGVALSGNISSAVDNESTATVLATGNWWGNATGPTVASNVGGTGEVIVENPGLVTYSSWCDVASCVVTPVATGGNGGGGRSGGSSRSTDTGTDTAGTVDGGATGEGQVLGASTYNFSANLTVGSTGADVNALQQVLIDAGLLKIAAPTGFFGPMTTEALKAWQAAHGVPATGFFGPLTMAAIAAATPAPMMTDEARAALIKDLLEKVKEIQEKLDAMEKDAA